MEDLMGDDQLRHAGAVVPTGDSFDGDWAIGTPVFMRGENKKPPEAAPLMDQHNEGICADLGYSADQIAAFKEAGILR